jgi:hypothetical protein
MHKSAPVQVKIVDGIGFNDNLFYHRAVRGLLASALWVNCRPPAGGNSLLTFLMDCDRTSQ